MCAELSSDRGRVGILRATLNQFQVRRCEFGSYELGTLYYGAFNLARRARVGTYRYGRLDLEWMDPCSLWTFVE